MTQAKAAAACVKSLLYTRDIRRVTYYVSPKLVAKATRQHRFDKRLRQETFVVTVGRPNYREREFIKLARAAREPFPIADQLTFWPRKRGAK